MPALMIGTYNGDDSVDVMMMAWGGICVENMVALNLEADHKTVANLRKRKAFTLAVPSLETLKKSDFFGIAAANRVNDKFARSGLHAVKSDKVDAGKLHAFAFDQMRNGCYAGDRKVGQWPEK